jgi:prepilin-type N-terminal cleavage/methylation domain-containing protein
MKLQLKARRGGFTLVELLVVITIIAVLAGVSMPVFSKVQMNGRMTAALQQTHGIYIALKGYAGDHDGAFPEANENANEGYRQLLPRYIEKEEPFRVPNCPWHKESKNGGKGPDNDLGERPDYSQALERGENHYAYVTGLNDGSSDSVGTYEVEQTKRGGVWKGEKAIVVYTDGQAKMELIDQRQLKILKKKGAQEVDLFAQDYGTDPSNVKNPE